MDLLQEHIDYIDNVIKSVVRGCDYEVALFKGNLYIFSDNSVYFVVNVSNTLGLELRYGCKKFESEIYPIDINQYNNIISKYRNLISTINPQNLLYENINVIEDEAFQKLNNLRASDGSGFYYINLPEKTICIPVFGGLPLLNKSDTVCLDIYRGTIPTEYIVNYKVNKKKLKTTYDIVFKILDINRPIRSF